MAAFSLTAENMIPKSVYGTVLTVNVHELTPEIIDVIGLHASLQPDDPAVLFGMHELRACTPRPLMDSVFCTRSPHYVLEVTPIVGDPGRPREHYGFDIFAFD
ncbi:hypothetical protein N7451_012337 [Penicillium sp. IBT 35674x]|nr:hypothetical protein N7451_012337 [Penicillium sp. IBT 35674x]